MEPRALGRSGYPTDLPLREVLTTAKHCSGGVILGFNQFTATTGIAKPGTKKEHTIGSPRLFPTDWNNLEAGMLYTLGKPLLIFREPGIDSGIFGIGTTEVFVHTMPKLKGADVDLKEVFLKWRDKVGHAYYS